MSTPYETSAWYLKLKDLHYGLITLREEYVQLLVDQEQARTSRAAALAAARQQLVEHLANAPEDLE